MTFDERLTFCRVEVNKWALAAMVGVKTNGEPAPGQPLVKVWVLLAPRDAEQFWKDVPGAKILGVNFAMTVSEIMSDDFRQILKDRWSAAMISMWELATEENTRHNTELLDRLCEKAEGV